MYKRRAGVIRISEKKKLYIEVCSFYGAFKRRRRDFTTKALIIISLIAYMQMALVITVFDALEFGVCKHYYRTFYIRCDQRHSSLARYIC
jgi:hypothetical protein